MLTIQSLSKFVLQTKKPFPKEGGTTYLKSPGIKYLSKLGPSRWVAVVEVFNGNENSF